MLQFMEKKVLYGLYVTLTYVGDDESHVSGSGGSSSMCVCASYDQQKLVHYRDVFNEADSIRAKIRPVMCIRETYDIKVISLL